MFFDPSDYLAANSDQAPSPVAASRLRREARQRAQLCRAMVGLAGRHGFEATSAHRVFGQAGLGSSTFYKLYDRPEDCLLEAFERCSAVVLRRVEAAVPGRAGPAERAEAGLRELVEILAGHPDIARLLVVEVRVGGAACREAQQRWVGELAQLLEGGERMTSGEAGGRIAAGAVASLIDLKVSAGEGGVLPAMLPELLYVALSPHLGPAAAEAAGRQAVGAR